MIRVNLDVIPQVCLQAKLVLELTQNQLTIPFLLWQQFDLERNIVQIPLLLHQHLELIAEPLNQNGPPLLSPMGLPTPL